MPSYKIARLGLQLVPEERRIFGGLTVAENLDLAALSNAIMAGSKRKTKFEPVQLKAEPDWYVRITLPHGEEIHIDEFKTEAGARAWIDDKSSAWLKKYRGGRYA